MKYYYAIIYCNNPKTANFLYDEYNGFEFENSNIMLNLSIVPDEIKFEQKVKEVASEVPADYEFSFQDKQQKLQNAYGHTNVKLTWDQTDPKRSEKLRNGFIREIDSDEEKDYYKDLIASSGDEQSDDDDEQIEKTRKKLLSGL